jgi:hypothetical protein
MQTAKEKFKIEQKVKMSPHGYQWLKPGKHREGTVVGFCRSPYSVQIRIHGYKKPNSYWMGFWSKI